MTCKTRDRTPVEGGVIIGFLVVLAMTSSVGPGMPLDTTATTSLSMTATVENAFDSRSSSCSSGFIKFCESWNAWPCCILESNTVMVWKARIFLGIAINGEVGRGMLALFGLSCVRWASAWLWGLLSLRKICEILWKMLSFYILNVIKTRISINNINLKYGNNTWFDSSSVEWSSLVILSCVHWAGAWLWGWLSLRKILQMMLSFTY